MRGLLVKAAPADEEARPYDKVEFFCSSGDDATSDFTHAQAQERYGGECEVYRREDPAAVDAPV